ncbi:MAG: prephenate dehydrogenase/arogenate dehydrogenase family protein [Gemmatimonadaceae bacterium]
MAPLDAVGIVGLGAIGGSLARGLVAHGVVVRAWSASDEDNAHARRAGIDVADRLTEVASAGTIVIAVPIGAIADVARRLLEHAAADAVLLHAGSLQGREALRLGEEAHARVVGTHPIAGSAGSGFGASHPDMFAGACVSIDDRATAEIRVRAEALWRAVGATELEYRDADSHDRFVAWMSQLPQLTATALAATIRGHGDPVSAGGPGARDTTRLAQSDWSVWRDLLAHASPQLPAALAALEATLRFLRLAIERGDIDAIAETWEHARAWRRAAEAPQ